MKTSTIFFALFFFATGISGQITGLWKVVDEKDGLEKSIIEIYENNNMYEGKVYKLLESSKRTHCEKCQGSLKDKPLTGMVIIYNVKKTDNGGSNGKILNPDNGKFYSCNIELESQDRLKLRGYLGVPSVGMTQYWNRVKEPIR